MGPTEKFHGSNTSFTRRHKIWLIHTLKRDLQNSSPFWPTEDPSAVPQPSASAFLACVRLCTALEGPTSPSLGLRFPCAALTAPTSPLKGSCCLCAAFYVALAKLFSYVLPLRYLDYYLSTVVVSLASDQIIPCQSFPSLHCKLASEFLANPALEFQLSSVHSLLCVFSN